MRNGGMSIFLMFVFCSASAQTPVKTIGSICGSVLDETGAPAAHIHIIAMLQNPAGHSGGYRGSRTDEYGHYCIDGLNLGKYVMSADDEKKGYPERGPEFYLWTPDPQTTLTTENPKARLDWQIPFKAGFLRLHLSVATGDETVPITFQLVVRSRPGIGLQSVTTFLKADQKSFITLLLPPGEDVLLTAASPGYRIWPDDNIGKPLNIRAGATEDLTIPLLKSPP